MFILHEHNTFETHDELHDANIDSLFISQNTFHAHYIDAYAHAQQRAALYDYHEMITFEYDDVDTTSNFHIANVYQSINEIIVNEANDYVCFFIFEIKP